MDQHPTDNAPSDEMFQAHFENLLNQQHTPVQDLTIHGTPEILVLDGSITYTEYLEAAVNVNGTRRLVVRILKLTTRGKNHVFVQRKLASGS